MACDLCSKIFIWPDSWGACGNWYYTHSGFAKGTSHENSHKIVKISAFLCFLGLRNIQVYSYLPQAYYSVNITLNTGEEKSQRGKFGVFAPFR